MPEVRLKGVYILELFKQEDLIFLKDNLRKVLKSFASKEEEKIASLGLNTILWRDKGICFTYLTHEGLKAISEDVGEVHVNLCQNGAAFLMMEIRIILSETFLENFHKVINETSEEINKKYEAVYSSLEKICMDVQKVFTSRGVCGVFEDLKKNWPIWLEFEYSGEGPSFKNNSPSYTFWQSLGLQVEMHRLHEEKGRFELFYRGLYDKNPSNIVKVLLPKPTEEKAISLGRLMKNVRADYFIQFAVFLVVHDVKERVNDLRNDISLMLHSLRYPDLVKLAQREQVLFKQKQYFRPINSALKYLTEKKMFISEELIFIGVISSVRVNWFNEFNKWINETCLSIQEEINELQYELGQAVGLKNILSNSEVERLALIISAGAFLAAVLTWWIK